MDFQRVINGVDTERTPTRWHSRSYIVVVDPFSTPACAPLQRVEPLREQPFNHRPLWGSKLVIHAGGDLYQKGSDYHLQLILAANLRRLPPEVTNSSSRSMIMTFPAERNDLSRVAVPVMM
jgi:hypothetical protein